MRSEVESALQSTTEMLRQVTHLLALVSAPPPRDGDGAPRRGAAAAAAVVMVVVITSTGGVAKKLVAFDRAGRPGPRRLGQRVPERAAHRRPARAPTCSAGGSTIRASLRASGRSSRRCGRPSSSSCGRRAALYVGGAASLLDDARADELEACRRLLSVLEQRAAVLELIERRLRRRAGRSSAWRRLDHPALQRGRARRRDVRPADRTLGAVGLLGPVRMDYAKAVRTVRAAAYELSRFVEAHLRRGLDARRLPTGRGLRLAAGWPPPNATTTSSSASTAERPTPRSRRRSASSRASSIPTSPTSPMRRRAFARWRRPTRSSPSPRRATCTTATATRGCAAAASRRATSTSETSPTSSRRSSATTSSRRSRGGRARGADVATSVDDRARRRLPGRRADDRGRGRNDLRALRGRRRRARNGARHVPDVRGDGTAAAGLAQRLRGVRPDSGLPAVLRHRAA